MRTLCYFLVCVLFSLSCTKFGKNVTVRGRVINYVTGEGIADQEIKLLRGGGGYNGGFKLVKNTYTDANGEYEIEKLGLNTYYIQHNTLVPMYDVGKIKNGEFVNPGISQIKIKKGKKQEVDFLVVPYGKLQIHIKNINCFDANDKLELYYDGAEIASTTYSIGKTVEKIGCVDNPGGPVEITMGKKFYHWIVTKNGVTTTVYDTVFVNETGITYFDVFY